MSEGGEILLVGRPRGYLATRAKVADGTLRVEWRWVTFNLALRVDSVAFALLSTHDGPELLRDFMHLAEDGRIDQHANRDEARVL